MHYPQSSKMDQQKIVPLIKVLWRIPYDFYIIQSKLSPVSWFYTKLDSNCIAQLKSRTTDMVHSWSAKLMRCQNNIFYQHVYKILSTGIILRPLTQQNNCNISTKLHFTFWLLKSMHFAREHGVFNPTNGHLDHFNATKGHCTCWVVWVAIQLVDKKW